MNYNNCYLTRDLKIVYRYDPEGDLQDITPPTIGKLNDFKASLGCSDVFLRNAIEVDCFSIVDEKLVFTNRNCIEIPSSNIAGFLNLGELGIWDDCGVDSECYYLNGSITTEGNPVKRYRVLFKNGFELDLMQLTVMQLFDYQFKEEK